MSLGDLLSWAASPAFVMGVGLGLMVAGGIWWAAA